MTCPVESKDALDYLIAIAPILISGAVGCIALAQYVTNKSKLRLDLYNRRFAIYHKTVSYYLACMKPRNSTDEAFRECESEFVVAYRESVFLFGTTSTVYEKLTEVKNLLSNPKVDPIQVEKTMLELEQSLLPSLDFHRAG
ncbi:MAG TPA: hypothetical protein VMV48_05565 [Gallionellaceae bacterium]|nr:hypothetical protein [Gallionellaceae bacterium]